MEVSLELNGYCQQIWIQSKIACFELEDLERRTEMFVHVWILISDVRKLYYFHIHTKCSFISGKV